MTYRGRHHAPRVWTRKMRDTSLAVAACVVVLLAGAVAGAVCFGMVIGVFDGLL